MCVIIKKIGIYILISYLIYFFNNYLTLHAWLLGHSTPFVNPFTQVHIVSFSVFSAAKLITNCTITITKNTITNIF